MSTVTTEPATTTAPAPAGNQVLVTEAPRSNILGVVALGLAIVGFILAALLLTAGVAWMLLFPAIILGVIALFLHNRRKGAALAAVIIALMGIVLSLVGFRLPLGIGNPVPAGVINNSGVNPFSVFTVGANGANGTAGQPGAAGSTTTGTGGLQVGVNSVDCHTPLATATGLNITGEVCAISVAVTNNGDGILDLNSGGITATVGDATYAADPTLGTDNLLDVQLLPGDSTVGTVYVNLPNGAGDIDGLNLNAGVDANVLVKLGN